jgi:ABC-2 type transport system permease protein
MNPDGRPSFPWPLLRLWIVRTLPAWCFVALMILLIQLVVCAIIHDNEQVKVYLAMIDMMPSFIKAAIGGETLRVGNVAALIGIAYQHPLAMLLLMLYAVGVPTGLLAGEVQRGTMELILSRHTTKTQVYVCAGLITVIGMFLLVLVMFLGTVVATRIYEFEETVPLHAFFKIAICGGILASAVGGLALLASACLRRATAVSLTVAFLVLQYFGSIVADWWPRMHGLKPYTIFYYVNDAKIFAQGRWPLEDMAILLGLLVVATVLGGIIWHRRDLPL